VIIPVVTTLSFGLLIIIAMNIRVAVSCLTMMIRVMIRHLNKK